MWIIDYGAYVDLISTRHAPLGLLPASEDDTGGHVEVPALDLRAIRRAILDLEAYTTTQGCRDSLSHLLRWGIPPPRGCPAIVDVEGPRRCIPRRRRGPLARPEAPLQTQDRVSVLVRR